MNTLRSIPMSLLGRAILATCLFAESAGTAVAQFCTSPYAISSNPSRQNRRR